VKSFNQYGIYN
jgi:hypothetical protein